MTDKKRLSKYISDLEEYIKKLEILKKEEKNKVLEDWKVQAQVERCLQVAIECLLNIGEMIINECKFRKPENYKDIIRVLRENKVIPKELRIALEDMAGFRNILVHDYLYLNYNKIYQHLRKEPRIIKKFIEAIKKFVARKQRK